MSTGSSPRRSGPRSRRACEPTRRGPPPSLPATPKPADQGSARRRGGEPGPASGRAPAEASRPALALPRRRAEPVRARRPFRLGATGRDERAVRDPGAGGAEPGGPPSLRERGASSGRGRGRRGGPPRPMAFEAPRLPITALNLSGEGLRLLGGRLLPSEAGPAALLMYEAADGSRASLYFSRGADP